MPRKKATLCFWCETEYDPENFRHYKIDGVMYWICEACIEWSILILMKSFLEKHPEFFNQTTSSKKELKKKNDT